uniref:Uncharacterized protein n=1 Tax=Myoviridae sp. ctCo31 TaxID=2825053 RepID=A0A8S5UMN0_9CAUD|nr:MAG TPA: hypothetical protein [Myoviridae sp. ctCo31]
MLQVFRYLFSKYQNLYTKCMLPGLNIYYLSYKSGTNTFF